jgi:hypothetical protein
MPRELRDDGRTYHDVTHALAVQDARAAVVEKARDLTKSFEAFSACRCAGIWCPHLQDHTVCVEEMKQAVRALDAVERGEP